MNNDSGSKGALLAKFLRDGLEVAKKTPPAFLEDWLMSVLDVGLRMAERDFPSEQDSMSGFGSTPKSEGEDVNE